MTSAVQKHGFDIEEFIKGIFSNGDSKVPYTYPVDLPASNNKYGFDLQIKSTGRANSVCMGDAKRVYRMVKSLTPIHLLVVIYSQINKKKKVSRVVEVDITGMTGLFDRVQEEDIIRLDEIVRAVPQKSRPTKSQHDMIYTVRDALHAKGCGWIHLDPKVNSQQSRLQCSFNRFEAFLNAHPERIVAQSDINGIFRGVDINHEFESDRRSFTKKTPSNFYENMTMKNLIVIAQRLTGSRVDGQRALKKVYRKDDGSPWESITSITFPSSRKSELVAFMNARYPPDVSK